MAGEQALVEFRNVAKSYDGRTAVIEGLNLQIARGEFITLLGPSGSGKTTALMLLAGFERASAGAILLDGRDITREPPHRRGMGVVFQSYALFPHMTVAENVAYPLRLRGVPRAEIGPRVDKALNMTRLKTMGERRPGQISGGQQQRAALARALVFEPALVLMDEPLGALDKNLREEMQFEIRALHRSLRATFVYVTHDQTEALTMSDRVAVFDRGQIRQLASPRALYETPSDLFVARFFGEMNLMSGTVQAVDGGRCTLALADGTLLPGTPVRMLRVGSPATLCVRPAALQLLNGVLPEGPVLKASVLAVDFLGDHLRLRCALADGQPVTAQLPATSAAPLPGAQISLGFEASAARLYPPLDGSAA